jgi:hypothetical protein
MANKIIKGFAIAAGTGLAIGFGNNRNRAEALKAPDPNGAPNSSAPEEVSEIDRLDERLSGIESRLSAVEARPVPADETISLAQIQNRFDRRDREIASLRLQMTETRQKVAAAVTVVERQFAEVSKDVPEMVESAIASHVTRLRSSLASELQASVDARLAIFEQAIDNKVAARMGALEKALVDQSGIITALSERALESDTNLQRLISAVEKLCERTEGRPAAPPPQSQPFEAHLSDAIKRPAAQPAAPQTPSGFRPAFVKEEEDLRPRRRLTRL